MNYIRKPRATPPPSDQYSQRIADLLAAGKCDVWQTGLLESYQASYESYESFTDNQKAKIDQIWRKRREGK